MTKLLALAATAAALATTAVAATAAFPKIIALPDGFRPEGIAIAGEQF
ncbi:hypothetical protein BH09ACT13_BH09ACT13_01300 [soil metagenome]